MPIIEVKNLTKKYGDNIAIKDVTFSLAKGEILGFLGVNGAGKTTTMNIIVGYTLATSGRVTIEKGANIGYLPEQPPLYLDMTVNEYLKFVFNLKKVKLNRDEHLEEIYKELKLGEVRGRLIKNLSKGYRQRVGVAQALIGNPEILILDEPTVGLDPIQIIEIRDLIKNLAKQRTVILSSHIMQEIESLATRVIIINSGKIIADGKLGDIEQKGENLEAAFLRLVMNEKNVIEEIVVEEEVIVAAPAEKPKKPTLKQKNAPPKSPVKKDKKEKTVTKTKETKSKEGKK